MLTRSAWAPLVAIAIAGCSGSISGEFELGAPGDGDGDPNRRDGAVLDGEVPDGCAGPGCVQGDGGALDGGGPQAGEGPVGGVLFDDEVRASEAFMLWRDEVQPLLATECVGCHMGQRFAFASLHRAGAEFTDDETVRNYKTFFPMISLDNPPLSRLLTKLLPQSDPTSQQHGDGGEAQLSSTEDPTYVTLARWIEAEKARRCPTCGASATRAFIAYVDRPDTHWAMDRSPFRDDYGYRHGAKIMLQAVDPATATPLAGEAPVEFLPSSFCGPSNACDFGALSANHRGDQLLFECRLSLTGEDWLELSWNICIAGIGPDGKAIEPRFVRPEGERHHGWTVARSDPYMIAEDDGLPLYGTYDEHARMRKQDDRFAVFGPDDRRIFTSSRSPDPRTGRRASVTYHGFEFTNNVISMDLNGGELRTVYLNEGGTAEHLSFLRNGNLSIHTWNLERMDRHLYTQTTQDGMMELPVLLGHVQGQSMWGSLAELPGGALLGITGRRRGSVEQFQAFIADHTLGTGLDPDYVSFAELDPALESELDIFGALCNSPPDGPNCSTARHYDDASYAPLDGALIAHNPVRTYYAETGVNDNLFQDRYSSKGDFASLQPYLPEHRIAFIDRKGNVRELIQPGPDRALRFPTWVGRRQAPILQEARTDESQSSAEFHIADVPLWFLMQNTGEQNQSSRMSQLDTIVALRVLVKVLEDNDCLNDGNTMRRSTYRGFSEGTVDHPTHLGITNGTGYLHLKVPQNEGGDAYGNVPLRSDRSVRLRLPAGRLLLLQGVDAQGHMVSQHTRLFSLPPGHTIETSVRRAYYDSQCMACHGRIGGSSYAGLVALGKAPAVMDFDTLAKASDPVDLTGPNVQARELTFLHALRPILDDKCVSCHSGAAPAGELTLEATYSETANYPAGRWAQAPHVLQSYLDFVPEAERVPGYNWSPARAVMLERSRQRQTFIPSATPYLPQGALAPWDPGYQTLFLSDTATEERFYYLTDHPYGVQVGRGGRHSDDSYLIEVLTGRDLAMRDYTGVDHTGFLTEAEVRIVMALIDNGMPFMARCSDKTVASGPNQGQPWGDPIAKSVP